ncbi:DUF1499 domain-containing protein [Thalassospira sp. MA62]|nr:DUF1499 domain-containing protein [Thalassospira sp. MA62]
MTKRLMMIVIWGLLVVVLCFAVVRFSGLLDHMLPAGTPPEQVLSPDVTLPDNPNYFFVCDADQIAPTSRRMDSPTFDQPPEAVAKALIKTAPSHGISLRDGSEYSRSLRFVARTPVFRFPDWIEIRLDAAKSGQGTTLCLFSQSVYGYADFEQNEKRARAWISSIRAQF